MSLSPQTFPKKHWILSTNELDSIRRFGSSAEVAMDPGQYPTAHLDVTTLHFDNYSGPLPDFSTFKGHSCVTVSIQHSRCVGTHPGQRACESGIKVVYKWSNTNLFTNVACYFPEMLNQLIADCLADKFNVLGVTDNTITCEPKRFPRIKGD